MDVLYAHDINDKRHTFLSMVDFGTTFHIVVPIESTSAAEIEKAFNDFWVTPYGLPSVLALDLETGLQSGVARGMPYHSQRGDPVALAGRASGTTGPVVGIRVDKGGAPYERWGRRGEAGSDNGQFCKK